MKSVTKTAAITILIFIVILFVNCKEDNTSADNITNYIKLEYSGFMKLPKEVIADSIAKIMNLGQLTINEEFHGLIYHDNLKCFIEKGYEYIADNGDKIRIWIGLDGKPLYADYYHRRGGDAEELTLEKSIALETFIANLAKLDVVMLSSDNISCYGSQSWNGTYYEMYYKQSYKDNVIGLPYFFSEIEGDTNRVNFLSITRFYTNINEITDVLSFDKLKVKAIEYYQNKCNVISIREELKTEGYYIIEDKLCVKIGSATKDEWGSQLYLFIDIQNGEIVSQESIDVD
ncbi:MAG: hypothetical protein V1779_13415 [bacterium]